MSIRSRLLNFFDWQFVRAEKPDWGDRVVSFVEHDLAALVQMVEIEKRACSRWKIGSISMCHLCKVHYHLLNSKRTSCEEQPLQ